MSDTIQYKISEEGIKDLLRENLIKRLPVILIAAFCGLGISFYQMRDIDQNIIFITLPIILVLVAGSMSVGLYIGNKRQREVFEQYTLTIDKDGITREQYNTATISIPYHSINQISKNDNGSFTIRGTAQDFISIPKQIESADKLEQTLAGIMPLTSSADIPFLQKYTTLISFVTIILYLGVYLSNDKMVVGIAGVLLIGVMGYSFYETQRSKNVDNTTKKTMWIVIFVGLSLLAVIVRKLSQ